MSFEVRPLVSVPASQAWFWSEEWQGRERKVDQHLSAVRVTTHGDVDALLAHLDALDADGATGPTSETNGASPRP